MLAASYSMPFEKCGHVLIAHELAPTGLLRPFPDRRSGCFIERYRLGMFCCDRKEHFSGLILIGLWQSSNLLNRLLKYLGHTSNLPYQVQIRMPHGRTSRSWRDITPVLTSANLQSAAWPDPAFQYPPPAIPPHAPAIVSPHFSYRNCITKLTS